jgi:hypothetical protein
MAEKLTRVERDRLALALIESQAEAIRVLKARLDATDPNALPKLNSAENDIERSPLVAKAIADALRNPSKLGATIVGATGPANIERFGAGTWNPVPVETPTTKASTRKKSDEEARDEQIVKNMQKVRRDIRREN